MGSCSLEEEGAKKEGHSKGGDCGLELSTAGVKESLGNPHSTSVSLEKSGRGM